MTGHGMEKENRQGMAAWHGMAWQARRKEKQTGRKKEEGLEGRKSACLFSSPLKKKSWTKRQAETKKEKKEEKKGSRTGMMTDLAAGAKPHLSSLSPRSIYPMCHIPSLYVLCLMSSKQKAAMADRQSEERLAGWHWLAAAVVASSIPLPLPPPLLSHFRRAAHWRPYMAPAACKDIPVLWIAVS